jgi:tetratricopeptide (TPR) repeat protein
VLSLTNYEFPSNYFFSVEQYYVPVLRLLFMPFALILALAVLGIAVEFRSRARGWPLYLLVLSTVAVLLIFYAGSRYRLPLVLPLAVFAGAGAVRVYDRMRNRRLPLGELAVIGFVLVLSWIFCGVPLAKRFAFTSALGFRNVGEAWLTAGAGRPSTAPRGRAAFTKALSIFEQNDQFDLTPLSANALSEIYTLRGETYAAEAKYDSAIIDYRAAQAADTRASRPTSRLAVTFYIRGVSQRPADSAVAHACLDTALFYIADWRRFDTTALEPSALEGDVQLARGDTARALAKYGELTAAVPRFEPAYRAIGTILLARGDTTKAVANYDRLLAADSNNVFANLMLGDIAAARHDTARAFFRYERAATLDTLALLPPRQLAVLHSARGSHSEAAGVLTRIIGRIERTVDLRNGILGSPPDAALYLEMKLRLALAFMNLNQWENAVAQTGEVLALNPGLATARQLADAAKQKVIPKFILW